MQRIIKLGDKIPVLTLSDFMTSVFDDCRCVMLTGQQVTIIRAMLWPYLTWRTRFGQWLTPDRFELATEEDYLLLQDVLGDLDYRLTGEPMANCFDTLNDGLQDIAAALSQLSININQNCGSSGGCATGTLQSSGIVGFTDGGLPLTGNTDPAVVEEGVGDPPQGFTSWEEYYTHKCRVANLLVDQAIQGCGVLGAISLFDEIVLSGLLPLAFAGVLPFPPVAIGTMITLLVAMGLSVAALTLLGQYLQDNRDALVCEVYNSQSAQAVLDVFGSKVDEWLETASLASNLHWVAKTLVALLLTTDSLNLLFEYTIETRYPNADCSGCDEDCPLIKVEEGESEGNGAYSAIWSQGNQRYQLGLTFRAPGYVQCSPMPSVSMSIIAGEVTANSNAFRLWDEDNVVVYASTNPPDGVEAMYASIVSNSGFTLHVEAVE